MKITVWLATRDRTTWIALAEVTGLAVVLLAVPGTLLGLVGFALLAHLGYCALTSLPMGSIPGRPVGAKQQRRNQDLRSQVVGFLNEVRRVEDFAQRARAGGLPSREVERTMKAAERRMMAAAAKVVRVTGRSVVDPWEEEGGPGVGSVLVHEKPSLRPQAH